MNMQAGSPVDAPSLALSMSVYHSVVGHFSEFDRGIKRARFAVLLFRADAPELVAVIDADKLGQLVQYLAGGSK